MRFFRAVCTFCDQIVSVAALKGTQSPNQWPNLILSSSSTGFLTEGALSLSLAL